MQKFSLVPGACAIWFTITFREKRIVCGEMIGDGFGRSDSDTDIES